MVAFPYDAAHTPPAPVIDVTIRHPSGAGPTEMLRMIADSGGDQTVVPSAALMRLQVLPHRQVLIAGFGGPELHLNECEVELTVPGHPPMLVCALSAIAGLPSVLGRDVLNRFLRCSRRAQPDARNWLTRQGFAMPPLVPPRFLVRVAHPCKYVKAIPRSGRGELLDLPAACQIDTFAALDAAVDFADVRLAWNELGIGIQASVTGKDQPPQGDANRPRHADGLTLWLDTRADRTSHRASRYCHQFHFLAAGAGRNATSHFSYRQKSTAPLRTLRWPPPVPCPFAVLPSKVAIGSRRSCRWPCSTGSTRKSTRGSGFITRSATPSGASRRQVLEVIFLTRKIQVCGKSWNWPAESDRVIPTKTPRMADWPRAAFGTSGGVAGYARTHCFGG